MNSPIVFVYEILYQLEMICQDYNEGLKYRIKFQIN